MTSTLAQTFPQVNPLTQLITDAATRYGFAPAEIEARLSGEITFSKQFPWTNTYTAYVSEHTVQVTPGEGVGCVTCAQQRSLRLYGRSDVTSRLPVCAAAAAAAVRWVVRENAAVYGQAFEEWRRAGEAGEAEPLPRPISSVEEAAQSIIDQQPELTSRVEKALELIEQGVTEFPQYKTSLALGNGGRPNWTCECPDATHCNLRSDFGVACKHTIVGQILWLVERDRAAVTNRRIADMIERDRAKLQSTAAAYDAALRPDSLNRSDRRRVHLEGIGHR
jgi:hypothetical protein